MCCQWDLLVVSSFSWQQIMFMIYSFVLLLEFAAKSKFELHYIAHHSFLAIQRYPETFRDIQRYSGDIQKWYQVYGSIKPWVWQHVSTRKVAANIVDRVSDISRHFSLALDVGCGRGHIANLMSDDLIGTLYQLDMAEKAVVSSRIQCGVHETFLDGKGIVFTRVNCTTNIA